MVLSVEFGNEMIAARRDLGTLNSFGLFLLGLCDAVLIGNLGLLVYTVRRQLDEQSVDGRRAELIACVAAKFDPKCPPQF